MGRHEVLYFPEASSGGSNEQHLLGENAQLQQSLRAKETEVGTLHGLAESLRSTLEGATTRADTAEKRNEQLGALLTAETLRANNGGLTPHPAKYSEMTSGWIPIAFNMDVHGHNYADSPDLGVDRARGGFAVDGFVLLHFDGDAFPAHYDGTKAANMEWTQNAPDLMNRVFNTVANYLFHEKRFAEIEMLEKLAEDVAMVVRAQPGVVYGSVEHGPVRMFLRNGDSLRYEQRVHQNNILDPHTASHDQINTGVNVTQPAIVFVQGVTQRMFHLPATLPDAIYSVLDTLALYANAILAYTLTCLSALRVLMLLCEYIACTMWRPQHTVPHALAHLTSAAELYYLHHLRSCAIPNTGGGGNVLSHTLQMPTTHCVATCGLLPSSNAMMQFACFHHALSYGWGTRDFTEHQAKRLKTNVGQHGVLAIGKGHS